MTISSSVNRVQYSGDGSSIEFPFTFGVFAVDDLDLILTDAEGVDTTLTRGVDYDVTLTEPTDLPSAGVVTFIGDPAPTPPGADEYVTIIRSLDYTQEIDITDGGPLPASSLNEAHDRAVMLIQQLKEILGRGMLLPVTSLYSNLTLPDPLAYAFMRWKPDASGLENVWVVDVGELIISPFIVTLADDEDAEAALTTLGLDVDLLTFALPADTTISTYGKTLIDDADAAAARATLGVSYVTAAEILTGTEAAKAIAPNTLLAARSTDASFWGIKNLRLIQAKVGDATRVQVNPNAMNIALNIGDHYHVMTAAVDVDSVDDLDTGTLAAGTDYYVYACTDGTTLSFKVSANSTNPSGFDTDHSRKIGGFHTLCVAVGTISGHTLTGYAQKDILPASVWCLKHRAKTLVNVGLVYDSAIQKWVDIYLASGTGTGTTSVNGGTISDTRNWMDFVDDGHAVGKRLPTDHEFTSFATGSNEETNITGSADPGTTSGHTDTAGRRMISNIGCEDCCGVMYQWLLDQTYYHYSATGYWGALPGGKGSVYTQFTADPGATDVDNSDTGGDIKLLAGGNWNNAAICGSRCRLANVFRWNSASNCGARFVAEPL